MADSGASSGSAAWFGGEYDSVEKEMAMPTVEETVGGETELMLPAISDEELGSMMHVPSLVSGIMSAELVSTSSGATASKAMTARSPSNPGARRAKPRGRTPPRSIADAPSTSGRKTSSALRTSSSPTMASVLNVGPSGARSRQIAQRRAENTMSRDEIFGADGAASEVSTTRSITDAVAATVLEAEFQTITEELDASRRQAARAARESERSKEALEKARIASLAAASERDQAVSVARDLAGFASESS